MSGDFENERKRHHMASKKRGRAVVSHFKTMVTKEARAVKDEQMQLRRSSARLSREVRFSLSLITPMLRTLFVIKTLIIILSWSVDWVCR